MRAVPAASVRSLPLLFGTLLIFAAAPASAALQNPGFETGSVNPGWKIEAAADSVIVTGAAGAFAGQFALRLGTPKSHSNAQNKGANRVSQQFPSTQAKVTLSLRIQSFEFRGDDIVTVNLVDPANSHAKFTVSGADGQPFSLPMVNGSTLKCSKTPCALSIDVGNNKDVLDSGWRTMTISGLPTDGRTLRLTYEVSTPKSSSHPTWAYFDDAPTNAAPTAVIRYNPGSEAGSVAIEGDNINFDCDQSSDPDGDALTCEWEVNTAPPITATGTTLPLVFPDDGQFDVTLTVSDGDLSDSQTATVTIDNHQPLVNALNVELLQGTTGQALCRFLDPGAADQHSFGLDVAGAELPFLFEENTAPLSSGYVTAGLAAGSTTTGTCTVLDGDGGIQTEAATFNVTVLTSAQLAARETPATNSAVNPPQLRAGGFYLGALESPGDIDVYEIRLPSGAALPVNSEINIRLDVPADYDLLVLSRGPGTTGTTPFVSAPFVSAPFVNAPFVNVPFVNVPFVNVPFVNVPFVNAPFVNAPFVSAPFVSAPAATSPFVSAVASGLDFTNFPLSQIGFAAPNGAAISGSDVGLGELGSLNLGALLADNVQVKGFSANLDTKAEEILVKVGPAEARLYVAVVSQSGGFATAPYSLRLEASTPPTQQSLLGENCVGEPVGQASTTTVATNFGASPTTLVVTQRERFMAQHGMSAAAYDEWLTGMTPFFTAVNARVISVPNSAAFAAADTDTCTIALQNAVATQVREIIQAQLDANPNIEYVQIVGGIDVIPPYYVPDETAVSNESLYSSDLWVLPGKPLSVATAEGYNITDAFYTDKNPQPFRGRSLYIEDVSISRMVETPAEILASAQAFDGQLSASRALATGYDFFIDGTDASATQLARIPSLTTQILNDDQWTATDLRCEFLGATSCAAANVNVLNAHMSYNAGISAAGFENGQVTGTYNDVFASTESNVLAENTLTLSIGCHSGLSVPDAWAIPPEAGLPFDAAFDWAQAPGTWIGPWGFGLGDTDVADRGTEGIMPIVLEELGNGLTLGKAMVRAKQRYAMSVFEFDVHDEKSLINLSLFGMPQARLIGAPAPDASTGLDGGVPAGTLALTLIDGASSTTRNASIARHSSGTNGEFYSLDGSAQSVMGRPLQGLLKVFETQPVTGTAVHGVALREGAYEDLIGVDPVFSARTHDWISQISEPQTCVDTLSPTQLGVVTTFATGATTLQSLLVAGSQFRCTDAGLPVIGDLRLYQSLTMEAMHPTTAALDGDFEPPRVSRQDVSANPNNNNVTAVVAASDASGLREVIALVYTDADGTPGGPGSVTSVTSGIIPPAPGATVERTLVLPNARGKQLAFQYVDHAGNLLMKSLKGALIVALDVDVRTSIIAVSGDTTITISVSNFAALSNPVLTMDFGDGTSQVLPLDAANVVVQPDGSALVSVSHTYGPNVITATIVATVQAGGASGTDTQILTRCADPKGDVYKADSDIITCAFSTNGTQVSIDLTVAGKISNSYEYAVYLPQSNKFLTWFCGVASGPHGINLQITKIGTSTLRFTFNAAALGWSGTTPLQFKEKTRTGDKYRKIIDQTQVFSITP